MVRLWFVIFAADLIVITFHTHTHTRAFLTFLHSYKDHLHTQPSPKRLANAPRLSLANIHTHTQTHSRRRVVSWRLVKQSTPYRPHSTLCTLSSGSAAAVVRQQLANPRWWSWLPRRRSVRPQLGRHRPASSSSSTRC